MCPDRVPRQGAQQGAQTGCSDRVPRQGAQTGCSDRVPRQDAQTGCRGVPASVQVSRPTPRYLMTAYPAWFRHRTLAENSGYTSALAENCVVHPTLRQTNLCQKGINTVPCDTKLNDTVRHDTARHGTTQHSTEKHVSRPRQPPRAVPSAPPTWGPGHKDCPNCVRRATCGSGGRHDTPHRATSRTRLVLQ